MVLMFKELLSFNNDIFSFSKRKIKLFFRWRRGWLPFLEENLSFIWQCSWGYFSNFRQLKNFHLLISLMWDYLGNYACGPKMVMYISKWDKKIINHPFALCCACVAYLLASAPVDFLDHYSRQLRWQPLIPSFWFIFSY